MAKGQTIVEYIILVGIAVTVLYVMGPAIKRGVQSVIKATSDQIAVQSNADQDFSPTSSQLNFTTTAVNAVVGGSVYQYNTATGYVSETDVAHYNTTLTNTLTEMGFSE